MSVRLDATQAALAAEHAAVYGYGVVGAKLRGSAQRRARTAHDTHRARRDQLAQLVRDEGGRPVASAAGYALPFPVNGPADATRLAAHLENAVAAAYADLVAAGDGHLRQLAARALQEAAVRAAAWSRKSTPFPGLTEMPAG
jgi:Domain of unknown function (DUF4439)